MFAKEKVKSKVGYPYAFVPQEMKIAIIKRSNTRSFRTLADVNNKEIEFLVDTGATHVALSLSDAERIGIDPNDLDFSCLVRIVVGEVKAAEIVINSIRLGEIEIFNVPAIVIPDMEEALLGMSFLSELYSYEFKNLNLIMKQQIQSSSKTEFVERYNGALFRTMAEVDGKTVAFRVDTCKSYVSITYNDAERLGFDPNTLIFSELLETSVGLFKVSEVLINSIRVGQIEVFNIHAYVTKELNESVLGLSFLTKLNSSELRDLGLVLRQ